MRRKPVLFRLPFGTTHDRPANRSDLDVFGLTLIVSIEACEESIMTVSPSFLLVMRHAEKPDDPYSPDLSPPGLARAEELAKYIPRTFGTPDFIIATAISKHSARPYETVLPLAKKVGKPIDATIADQDYRALAADLMSLEKFSAKQCVICWHHEGLAASQRDPVPLALRPLRERRPMGRRRSTWGPTTQTTC